MKISMHNLSHGDVALHDVIIPGAPLTNFNDGGGGGGGRGSGGPTQVHILYPKFHNFRICPAKKITTFFFYHTQKIP